MNMNAEELIIKLMDEPDTQLTSPEADLLRGYISLHPASAALPAALLLRCAPHLLSPDEAESYRQLFAATASDRTALFRIASSDGRDFDEFFRAAAPARSGPVSTESAIDTFLETFGHQSPEEDALLERLIFNPVPDYSEVLAAQEDTGSQAPSDATEAAIDAFLGSAAKPEPAPAAVPEAIPEPAAPARHASKAPEPSEPAATDSLLSESLAKIFIRQGRYERAYEIISNLNLNFPQKSCYFADQLRFLQKLILIKQQQSN